MDRHSAIHLPLRCRLLRHYVRDSTFFIKDGRKQIEIDCECGRRWKATPVRRKTKYRFTQIEGV
jgi:hypothetical protein